MALRALCIGINDYSGVESDLSGCVNDALDWQSELTSRGFAVRMLLDRDATKANIVSTFREEVRQLTEDGLLVLTFSGHGSFVPDENGDEGADGRDECICPADVDQGSVLVDDEIDALCTAAPKGSRVVLIIDACHSGTVSRFSDEFGSQPNGLQRTRTRFLPPQNFLPTSRLATLGPPEARTAASPPGRYSALLLAGCRDTEYSYDGYFEGRAGGAFTRAAIAALGRVGSGATYADWIRAVREYLPSSEYPQTPQLYGSPEMKNWPALVLPTTSSGVANGPTNEISVVDGPPLKPRDRDGEARRQGTQLARRALDTVRARRGGPPRARIFAEGDSWFDFPLTDVLVELEDEYDYRIESVAHRGDTLEGMAFEEGQLRLAARKLRAMIDDGRPPEAILLSGGGNDLAGDEFLSLLNHQRSGLPSISEHVAAGLIDERLRYCAVSLIQAITALCESLMGRKAPILVHGYDYPIPDGRGFAGGWWLLPGPWLGPAFERKGYEDLRERVAIMKQLIDRYNRILAALVEGPEFSHVHYVDLRGVLGTGLPKEYRRWWGDELHPTRRGFGRIATRIHEELLDVLESE